MSDAELIRRLIADGFDHAFARKATEWFAREYNYQFRLSIKDPVRFIKDNEYIIRHW